MPAHRSAQLARVIESMPKHTRRWAEWQVEWLVSRLHVSMTEEEIRADFTRRIKGPKWTEAEREEVIAYALKVHRANCALYTAVMGGAL